MIFRKIFAWIFLSALFCNTVLAQVPDSNDSVAFGITDDSQFHVLFPGTWDFEESEKVMYEFLYDSYIMPFNDFHEKTEGTIYAGFTVEKSGKVSNPRILKGLTNSADSELVRVLRTMPNWYRDTTDSKLMHIPFQKTIRFDVADSLFQCSESWHPNDEEFVYGRVSQMPQFPGGDDSLVQFISRNLLWPNTEVDCNGTVYITFIVQPDGTLKKIQLLRSLCPKYDEEAMRVIEMFPVWEPGKCYDIPVPVRITLPIRFSLYDY